ncbi:MAG: hypothetical protein ACOVQI_04650, partial [Tagaea sp.]
PSPSIHAVNFATNTMAVIRALKEVNGDLSGNQANFQRVLAAQKFKAPTGADVSLDHNRQAISDIFLTRIEERNNQPMTVVFQRATQINQTLGTPEAAFLALGAPSRTNTGCIAAS